jgi:hypothetical protein
MKKKFPSYASIGVIVIWILMFCPEISLARLGQSSDSISLDQKAFSASRHSVRNFTAYTIEEIKNETVTIRQYVSSSNVIFAVAWTGLMHPDLNELLGSYASEYQRTIKQNQRQRGRRYFRVATQDIIVEKWGHMRRMHGRAYIPSLIPDGVGVDEIK